jgi:molecular chaperone GrpE
MSEFAPPAVPDDAAVRPQEPLSPAAVEALLEDFRSWLAHAPAPVELTPPDGAAVDVFTLLGQFVALKHEVNLQTKATRAQQQQNADTLQQLARAVELLEGQNAALEQAKEQEQEEQLKPVLKTLVDLWDALSLAQRETQRLNDSLRPLAEPEPLPEAPAQMMPTPTAPPPLQAAAKRSFWARLFGRGGAGTDPAAQVAQQRLLDWAHMTLLEQHGRLAVQHGQLVAQHARLAALAEQQRAARDNEERLRATLASVLTGYTMSLQRLERALAQHGLEPLDCVGQPFDPETMEVVEVVAQPGRAGTEVLEEVRRGYRRRGRVFRYAQVRVARP